MRVACLRAAALAPPRGRSRSPRRPVLPARAAFGNDKDVGKRLKDETVGGAVGGAVLGGLLLGPFGAVLGGQFGANLGSDRKRARQADAALRKQGITPEMVEAPWYFELPPTGTLYLVPQTLYKLHPDFDELMRRVLLADASGTSFIAMPVAQLEDWSEQVRARWRERIADVEHRILLVRRMAFDEFNALAALADVVPAAAVPAARPGRPTRPR